MSKAAYVERERERDKEGERGKIRGRSKES
jgi:hypothetical protein